ncbi:MAG: hypothetical protein ABJA94_09175 [Rhodoglobus sp.]
MTDPTTPPNQQDLAIAAVELSLESADARRTMWKSIFAVVVAACWVLFMSGVAVIWWFLATTPSPSTVTVIALVWVGLFATVVVSWLFWNISVPVFANIASRGRFSSWREAKLKKFDKVFAIVAMALLFSVVLVPAVKLFE